MGFAEMSKMFADLASAVERAGEKAAAIAESISRGDGADPLDDIENVHKEHGLMRPNTRPMYDSPEKAVAAGKDPAIGAAADLDRAVAAKLDKEITDCIR